MIKKVSKQRQLLQDAAKFVMIDFATLRKSKRVTQAKLAEIAQISTANLSKKERRVDTVTIDDYLMLCYSLKIDPVRHLSSSLELFGIKRDFWTGGDKDGQ